MLRFENPRTTIPFVIPPGNSVYLSVEINSKSLPHNAAFLDIEMVQESVGWWGKPLRSPFTNEDFNEKLLLERYDFRSVHPVLMK